MATLNNFVDEIYDEIDKYSDTIKKELEIKLDETADKILDYVRTNAPRSGKKGALADEFVKQEVGSGYNKSIVIYASNRGRIVHLIEFGFQHRNGKYIAARPFMRPAYDTFTPKMIDDIRSIIRGQ